MGSNSKTGKKDTDSSLLDEGIDFERMLSKKFKPLEGKGTPICQALISEEEKTSSSPPSPVPFLSLDGRTPGHKPAEIFRTDLISAMKLPDNQLLQPENYMNITDTWRQEWERGVQVPVHPECLSQPSVRPVEVYFKRSSTFKLVGKLMNSSEKRKGKTPCIYDLNRMDVEWLTSLNKSRHNKGKIELEEGTLEKAIAYFEDKCYENMGYAIVTQKGLSIEYDESVCCEVCQSPDSEESNEMVFCDACDICVHQACYGIQSIPEGSWLCQPCRWGVSSPLCKLCSHKGGAMKKAKGGKTYIHVSCALWVPEVGFGSVERMEPIIKVEKIPNKRWNLVCYLCKEKVGACIQCTVKTCVTAFHVTCGFMNGLDMKTVLDDTAADGVRHISYCGKHGHKNKSPKKSPNRSPQRSPEKTKQNKEEAENLRQKRLKQMEGEFYKYVEVAEAAKDLVMPKELVSHIHAYWTLKRKARDDVPLLPPTSEQQEKLSGKQGAADISRNLQIQIERLMKMRCDLERLRNLCYMVGKREKMRRELFRVREQVFWKARDVMTDETLDIDDNETHWIRAACRENFSGNGSTPVKGPDGEDLPVRSDTGEDRFSTSYEGVSPEEVDPKRTEGEGVSPLGVGVEPVREDEDSSDSDSSGSINTRRRSLLMAGSSMSTTQNQQEAEEPGSESNNTSNTPRDAMTPSRDSSDEDPRSSPKRAIQGRKGTNHMSTFHDAIDTTPRKSLGILGAECSEVASDEKASTEPSDKVPSPRTKWKENLDHNEVPETPRTRQRKASRLDSKENKVPISEDKNVPLVKPRTRGKSTEDKLTASHEIRDEVIEASPVRSLRSRRQLAYHSEAEGSLPRAEMAEKVDDALRSESEAFSEGVRGTRSRSRQTSTSGSEDDVISCKPAKLRKISESGTTLASRTTRLRSESEGISSQTTGITASDSVDDLNRKTTKARNPSESDSSPTRETRSSRLRRISSSAKTELNQQANPDKYESDSTESDEVSKENQPALRRKRAFSDCGFTKVDGKNALNKRRKSEDVRSNRRARDRTRNSIRRSVKDNSVDNNSNTQSRITEFLLSGSAKQNLHRSSKAKSKFQEYTTSDNTETDSENMKSDEENFVDRVQRLSSLRSFSNGKEVIIPDSPCPDCQIQHDRHPEYSAELKERSPARRNSLSRELRLRNSPSPSRSRGRLSSGLRFSPGHSCSDLLAQVCHATLA